MAVSNRDRVGRAFELLASGLEPYVDRRMRTKSPLKDRWWTEWASRARGDVSMADPAELLKIIAECWDLAFRDELGRSDRNVVFTLRDTRNKWAHNSKFDLDGAYRALDGIEMLLKAIDAAEADEVGESKDELMRLRYASEVKAAAKQEVLIASPPAGLKPWREVIVPHEDVAGGRFNQAEFAADLWQVQAGQGRAEYVEPVEFFRRTFLTEGLRTLLTEAAQRVTSSGGVPVVDLQTNFGGGKTHSQIALWHLFSGTPIESFPDEVQTLLGSAGVESLPAVRRAVLVGTKVPPGEVSRKADGTEVRTLWGELAWQLGGQEGFALVADADRTATNPGEKLNELLEKHSPCLILIDEWVAYARQLADPREDLVGGSFDTQFTFAQALTEAARAVPGALLVVSLPASEGTGESGIGSDIELGSAGGREALRKLRMVIGRMESSWRPATAEESFEIVRRRLFRPLEPDRVEDRDATAQAFGRLYQKESSEFPAECREPAYVERMRAAYPIHPELFARLYEDWSTLDRFQRTRGVLRLMASVIHALWEAGDQSPLILPSSIPLADAAVSAELTRNLDDQWKPIIDHDIDGTGSVPVALDRELAGTLGKFQAARRVSRCIFLGSAPTVRSANRGIDPARIRLGCVLPTESIATYGDALSRLSGRATYLYQDGGRYWFGVQPSVARVARDRAERFLNSQRDELHLEIVRRLRAAQSEPGEFRAVHPPASSSADIPDEPETRLVILGPDHPHIARSDNSAALAAAAEILDRRGNAPRDYRNCLVFLAPDNKRLDELEQAVADYLAWSSVDAERGEDGLNLDPNQARQAATKRDDSERAVTLRLAETYQWVLVPTQPDPLGPVTWDKVKVDGQSGLALRASKKLTNEAHLYTQFAPALLRQRLDAQLSKLWADGHVPVTKLWDAFARYLYLPRLRDQSVLLTSVGTPLLMWQTEGFATADAYDDAAGRYLGLSVSADAPPNPATLVVAPDRATAQLDADRARASESAGTTTPGSAATSSGDAGETGAGSEEDPPRGPTQPVRFHAAFDLDPERLNRDFGKVSAEVISHLTGLLGTDVRITIEIEASNGEGFPDTVVRNVTENARTLRFDDYGFEER
ncbi:MAG: ATP-binding protein [Acidimicrobiia bacterium]|nr:ATP-binding protein [Acidimicrobiia bacterium]